MQSDSLPFGGGEAASAFAAIGLPSSRRYNIFVARAVKSARDYPAQGTVWAILALAEATRLNDPS